MQIDEIIAQLKAEIEGLDAILRTCTDNTDPALVAKVKAATASLKVMVNKLEPQRKS